MPPSRRTLVLDVSNQNPITAAELAAAAPAALICKATEGAGAMLIGHGVYPLDPTYDAHRRLAAARGIPFGGYLFLHPSSSGNEAAWFLRHARPRRGDIQPVIDAETRDAASFARVAARVDSCAQELERAGFRPLLYSYTSFLQAVLRERPKLARLRVWQAGYTVRRPRVGEGASVVAWQFTDKYPAGVGRFDCSRLYVPLGELLI